jgi:hypothetical protein
LGRVLTVEERHRTVLAAAREVGSPVFFGVLIITIVYLPILSLTGVEGKMFQPMALTVMLALGGALALAMTLMPVLASFFLGGSVSETENALMRWLQRVYSRVLALGNDQLDPVFAAVVQATEEAVVNALVAAETMTGQGGHRAVALPHDRLAVAARTGRLHRNFQGYTTDDASTLIGLGASSISRSGQGYVQNHAVERDWRSAVAAGCLPVGRGLMLTKDDARRADVIERLMCDFAVHLTAVERRHGPAPDRFAAALARLEPLVEDGLVCCSDGALFVTELGRPFIRLVCAAFDATLAPSGDRHGRMI